MFTTGSKQTNMVAAKLLRLRTKPKGDITVVTSIF